MTPRVGGTDLVEYPGFDNKTVTQNTTADTLDTPAVTYNNTVLIHNTTAVYYNTTAFICNTTAILYSTTAVPITPQPSFSRPQPLLTTPL
jgi:hypothetical protein